MEAESNDRHSPKHSGQRLGVLFTEEETETITRLMKYEPGKTVHELMAQAAEVMLAAWEES